MTENVTEYRIGDAFYLNVKKFDYVRENIRNRFPDSIMGQYLSQKTNAGVSALNDVLERHHDSGLQLSKNYDCLVALRTGDVMNPNLKVKGIETKLPPHPSCIASAVKEVGCKNTMFLTGKHGKGEKETVAFLADLKKNMDDAPHHIQITSNDTVEQVDDDLYTFARFPHQVWTSSGGFHQLIHELRRDRKLPTSTDLAYKKGNSTCVDRKGYQYTSTTGCGANSIENWRAT